MLAIKLLDYTGCNSQMQSTETLFHFKPNSEREQQAIVEVPSIYITNLFTATIAIEDIENITLWTNQMGYMYNYNTYSLFARDLWQCKPALFSGSALGTWSIYCVKS